MSVLAVVLGAVVALFVSCRLAIWQADREHARFRRATLAVFDEAAALINQGQPEVARELVDIHLAAHGYRWQDPSARYRRASAPIQTGG